MGITTSTKTHKYEFFILPTFGIVSCKSYYGYPVYAIAFAWGFWGICFKFGVRKAEV